MLKAVRLMAATCLLLFLMTPFASNTQAQLCLYEFARFEVLDSAGKRLPDVTIQLLGEVSLEDFKALQAESHRREISIPDVKLFPQEVEEIVKRSRPMREKADICGNPFKQRFNSTKVKRMHKGEGSKENFGFCNAVAHNRQPLLLKISAPGYVTDFYVGKFLSDCITYKSFILSKEEKVVKKQR